MVGIDGKSYLARWLASSPPIPSVVGTTSARICADGRYDRSLEGGCKDGIWVGLVLAMYWRTVAVVWFLMRPSFFTDATIFFKCPK